MPRSQDSPIARMLRFFKESSVEVAQIGLDLARDVVKERNGKASVAGQLRAAAVADGLRPKVDDPPHDPVQRTKGGTPQRRKPGRPPAAAKAAKPKPLTAAQKKEAAREAQRIRDQRKAAKRKAAKAAAAKALPGGAVAGKTMADSVASKRTRRKRAATAALNHEAPLDLPDPGVPVAGDLDFVDEQLAGEELVGID